MDHCSKSNEKSTNLRTSGNKFYVQKKFFDAILKYNESLCYADENSENSGLAYANRSAVYFEMKLYEKSLKNIELAKANNYPEKNIEILNKREEKCREMMTINVNESTSTDDLNFFKLSHGGHKNVPTIVSCLQLKCDKKYGRHIVTNKSLAVGDIIAIEEPFCKVVKENFIYQRCANCFKSNLLDLQPCLNCNQAMFCSHDCAEIGLKNFHRWECPIMQHILSSSLFNSNMRVALRIFFMSLTIFDDSIEDLQKFINENSPSNVTMFDYEMKLNMKQKLLTVYSLISDDSLIMIDFKELFQLNQKLKEMWSSHKDFIRKFLKKQTQIAALNCHEIYGWPLKKGGLNPEENENNQNPFAYRPTIVPYANGCYPFYSLLNHSCAPNVCKIFIDDKLITFVQRKIDAGKQIFDNYGFGFTDCDRNHRQMELYKQYKFHCECEACVNHIGLLPALKICNKVNFIQAQKVCKELSSLDQKRAKQRFKDISKIIQSSKDFPSLEICSLMQSFCACLEIISKPKVVMP